MHTPSDAAFWDARYASDDYAYGTEPNAFLASVAGTFPRGSRVLVPADGEGRNGVWLAEHGFDVTTVDMSRAGCDKARSLAARRGVSPTIICADLTTWSWPVGTMDAVAAIFLHLSPALRAPLHAKMRDALAPGGLIVLEAFEPAHVGLRARTPSVGGPADASLLYTPAMLRGDFAGLIERRCETAVVALREGAFHDGESAVVRAVFEVPRR
ncbi:MAG: class I SAM-dependent methyltransferase [Gemmatimonadaceae bacterium]|jgi:hypothetical protein|nr:class I SAM-dependent methyltransferase [Gemmatimonadaceae bacterium]MCU0627070.1 class I SAM-dependent methyltransferase [Gemmatimonadaceae bacterium]